MPGPIPKRSDQRRRVNKPEVPIDSAPSAPPVPIPDPDPSWHQLARDWFVSLGQSGQAVFYQPSDWAVARVWAEILSRQLQSDRISAVMVTAWASSASELLTTEGARRRARLELDHAVAADPDDEAAVTSMSAWRATLGA